MSDREEELRSALLSMVQQFAYWSGTEGEGAKPDAVGSFWHGGLSALEEAFDVLGWDDTHPAPEQTCDQPGCTGRTCCGIPTPDGYRSVCSTHYRMLREALA